MDELINLDNNYCIKNTQPLNKNILDIDSLTLASVFKQKKLLFKVNFNQIAPAKYKKIIRKLLFIKNAAQKANLQIGENINSKTLIGYVINYNSANKNHTDFIQALNAIYYNTRYERYNYIYDAACNYLDSFFYGKNLCDFKDNKCGEKQSTSVTTGCCHHPKIKWLGPFTKLVLCEYLKEDYTCGAKCIGCKLFTCDYLEKKGIKFRIRDILLLDAFFNPLQKYFIKYMVFTPKEKILKRIMIL